MSNPEVADLWESEGLEAAMTTWSEQLRDEGRAEAYAEAHAEGRVEGLARGRVEGIVGVLVRMARHRFGEATASTTAALLGSVTSEAALDEIGACLLTCENGDALIAKIRQI